jgi:HisJ family histidinol phosphate phosphatase
MKEPWIYRCEKKVIHWNKAKRIPDMHSHTIWCNHSTNKIENISKQLSVNKVVVAINEHLPYPDSFYINKNKFSIKTDIEGLNEEYFKRLIKKSGMSKNQIKEFVNDLKGNNVAVGIEVGILTGLENDNHEIVNNIEEILNKENLKLNHVSGSVHCLDGYDLFSDIAVLQYMNEKSPEYLIKRYFDIHIEAVETGKYDFICHQGMVHFFYNSSTKSSMMNNKKLRDVYFKSYEKLLDIAKQKNVGVEINTSGIDRPNSKLGKENSHKDYYIECVHPHMPIDVIKMAIDKKVIITCGSDWHHAGEEQRYFDQLYDVLLKLKAKEVYKIIDRTPISVKL